MRIIFSALIVSMAVAAAIAATSAAAQDRMGYAAISQGKYAVAEKALTAERRIFPDRPELMLNLAAVYARTARPEQARALYQEVIARPDILMDLPNDRTASSHMLAETGLKRLADTQISAR